VAAWAARHDGAVRAAEELEAWAARRGFSGDAAAG
jgi:hypothetical protein